MNALSERSGSNRAAGALIRLRRDRAPPLRFAGRLIAQQSGRFPQARLWHDIALYRAYGGGWAVAIVAWRADIDVTATVRCHADLFPSLDEAVQRIETHKADADICPGLAAPDIAIDDPRVDAATLLIQAVALDRSRRETERRYRIVSGTLLASLAWHVEPTTQA